MDDAGIVELYWQRDETAITQTEEKYGRYLCRIARNILSDHEDSLESVNDTYLSAWESMPPHRPQTLRTYLVRITRQISIDRYRRKHSQKRGGSQYALSIDELNECVAGGSTPENDAELIALAGAISDFLRTRTAQARRMFVCRYYFADSIEDIAVYIGTTQSAVKSSLHRTRAALGEYLTREGFM